MTNHQLRHDLHDHVQSVEAVESIGRSNLEESELQNLAESDESTGFKDNENDCSITHATRTVRGSAEVHFQTQKP